MFVILFLLKNYKSCIQVKIHAYLDGIGGPAEVAIASKERLQRQDAVGARVYHAATRHTIMGVQEPAGLVNGPHDNILVTTVRP